MGTPSLSKAEYLVTFIDGYSHYTWVYPLKRKDQVFETFVTWKTLVENTSGRLSDQTMVGGISESTVGARHTERHAASSDGCANGFPKCRKRYT